MPSNVRARAGRFEARMTRGGELVQLGTFGTEAAAERAVALARGGLTMRTVGEWMDQVWELYPGRRSAATTEHYRAMCAPFARAHGGLRLDQVDGVLAQHWAAGHPAQVRFLRRAFGKARRAKLLVENVWEDVEVYSESTPRVPPSPAELAAILAACARRGGWWAENFAPMIEVAAYTGARLSGLAGADVADVDLVAGRLTVTEKGEKTRQVALLGASREALARRCAGRVGMLFSARMGRRHTIKTVDLCFRAVADDAGFPGTFHSLKHFATTWLRGLGAAKDDVAIQMGHFDVAGRPYPDLVDRVYAHPDHEVALARLDAVVSGASGLTGSRDMEGSAA